VVAEAVGVADQSEPPSGKARLHALDKGIDAGMPLAPHQRIDISSVLGPGGGDQRPAALRVGLVPKGDLSISNRGGIGHGRSP
jgi:hypothetical protein